MKREVAAKAGNFRGVCPSNGRKNSEHTRDFAFSGVCWSEKDRKVRFCKGKAKTPETVFKENAPFKIAERRKTLHLLYIRAQNAIYSGAVIGVAKRNLKRRHKKWQ